jgi:hypothetical protein
MGLRHRVVPTRMKRVAAEQSPTSEGHATPKSVASDRLFGKRRTRGLEAATGSENRSNAAAIKKEKRSHDKVRTRSFSRLRSDLKFFPHRSPIQLAGRRGQVLGACTSADRALEGTVWNLTAEQSPRRRGRLRILLGAGETTPAFGV